MRDLQQEIAKWYTTLLLALLASFPLLVKELAPQVKPNGTPLPLASAASAPARALTSASTPAPVSNDAESPHPMADPFQAMNVKGIAKGWAAVTCLLTLLTLTHICRLNWRFRQMQQVLKHNDPLTADWDSLVKPTEITPLDAMMNSLFLPHRLTCLALIVVGIVAPIALYIVMFGGQ